MSGLCSPFMTLLTKLLLLRRLSLFQLRVGAFVVGLKDRKGRIVVLFTEGPRLIVERFRELDSAAALIRFSKTVVNVRRARITFDVRLEDRDRFFRFAGAEQLVTHLVDQVLRRRNRIAEFLAQLFVMLVNALQAAAERSGLRISRSLPTFIDLSQSKIMTAQHH